MLTFKNSRIIIIIKPFPWKKERKREETRSGLGPVREASFPSAAKNGRQGNERRRSRADAWKKKKKKNSGIWIQSWDIKAGRVQHPRGIAACVGARIAIQIARGQIPFKGIERVPPKTESLLPFRWNRKSNFSQWVLVETVSTSLFFVPKMLFLRSCRVLRHVLCNYLQRSIVSTILSDHGSFFASSRERHRDNTQAGIMAASEKRQVW